MYTYFTSTPVYNAVLRYPSVVAINLQRNGGLDDALLAPITMFSPNSGTLNGWSIPQAFSGQCLQFTATASTVNISVRPEYRTVAAPNQTYLASAQLKGAATTSTWNLVVRFFDGSGALSSQPVAVTSVVGTNYVNLVGIVTAPADAAGAAIRLEAVSGVANNDVFYTDQWVFGKGDGPVEIPFIITDYSVPIGTAKLTPITGMPNLNAVTNNATDGNFIFAAPSDLPKMTISGFMDTPSTPIGLLSQPNIFRSGYRVTYADIISHYATGAAYLDNSVFDTRLVHPEWVRDAWGRVFTAPRVTAFTANYVEGVPGRTNFTMTLSLSSGGSI